MMTKQLEAYQNNAITTASGPQLTMMLYNGCIKFINQGIKAVNEKDYEMKNTFIQKAQDIIQELMLTLNQEIEISKQLLPLYDYIYYLLQQGNIKNDINKLEEALEFVTEFRDTWKEVLKQGASNYEQGAQV
ncbi:MAG TPA: flagellar export chaperone FliS [Pseudogracilibacillus sp.]|nr:flagellar export chaperone FliS [Pseudogracilibacillus sp.]